MPLQKTYMPSLCPKCENLIITREQDLFVVCPTCDEKISVTEAVESLDKLCAKPSLVTEIIAKCLELEKDHGEDLPLAVLSIVAKNFPYNEEVAYLIVRMSDFEPHLVRSYLLKFKETRKRTAFTEDFLTKGMSVRNMEFANMFEEYITNKLPPKRAEKYIELLRELKHGYTKTSSSSTAIGLLYGFYGVASALNVGAVFWFIFDNMPLFAHILVGLGLVVLEILFMFLHNRSYGSRLEISKTERLLMTIYMSSVVILIGGIFLGWFLPFW
jgi:hypothetical protein